MTKIPRTATMPKPRTEPTEEEIEYVRRYRHNWPRYARDVLNVRLDPIQEAVLQSVHDNPRTIVRSGHARGKDYVTAVAALCFLFTRYPSKVICTAPTERQVKHIMMAEAETIYNNAVGTLGGKFLDDGIRFQGERNWFLLGFKAADKKVEAWTGFHSPNLLLAVTEASGIAQETWDSAEGLLTGNSRLLAVLNPNRTVGETYEAFKSPLYTKFTLSCLDAPNVVQRRTVIPGQVNWEWVDTMVKKAGMVTPIEGEGANPSDGDFEWDGQWYRPSDLFRVKVQGLWPREPEDQLIPLAWVEAAHDRWYERQLEITAGTLELKQADLRLGADVAGMGIDLTVFCPRYIDYVDKFKAYPNADHMDTAERIREIVGKEGEAYVDTIGEGAGVHSRLQKLDVKSASVKFSEGAVGLSDLTEQRKFLNMRAYCWWAIRDALDPKHDAQLALPPLDELTQDLTAPRWSHDSQGRIRLEAKDEIKVRLGRSPDFGDALANTFYPYPAGKGFAEGVFDGLGAF